LDALNADHAKAHHRNKHRFMILVAGWTSLAAINRRNVAMALSAKIL